MNGAIKTITADSLVKGLRYQDGIGGIFTYAYNEKGDMVSYRNADGTGEDYAYDENGNITKNTYPDGMTTIEETYDIAGNLLILKDALKSTMVQSFNWCMDLLME